MMIGFIQLFWYLFSNGLLICLLMFRTVALQSLLNLYIYSSLNFFLFILIFPRRFR